MPRTLFHIAALACALFAAWVNALAQSPAVLNYRGHIDDAGRAFDGDGWFTFAILDAKGVILWSSGEFPMPGKTNVPPDAIQLKVVNGEYSVRLGETNKAMPPLDGLVLRRSPGPKLRIWFNDGTRGWQAAGEDISLTAMIASATGGTADLNGNSTAPMTAAQADAIMRELRELRAQVGRGNAPAAPKEPPPPAIVTVPVGDSPVLGSSNAPLVLVEFTDFQCPFCKRFHDTVMPGLITNYVNSGKLKIVSRSLPLPFHPNAPGAASAALCAHAQGQFWPMREKLFADIGNLGASNYLKYAQELKLNTNAFLSCTASNAFAAQIARDSKDAEAVKITGTPTFVLGKQNGTNVTGTLLVGYRPYESFAADVAKAVGGAK